MQNEDEKKPELRDEDKCGCDKNPKSAPHTCPYASEINGDDEKLCTCCEECTYQCAMDI